MMLIVMQGIAILLLLILMPYYLMFMTRRARLASRIPGPKPLPLIGNALEFGRDGVQMLKNLRRLRQKYGSIFRSWMGPYLVVWISDPRHAEIILASNINISKSINYTFLRNWGTLSLGSSAAKQWRHDRKLLNPAFHFNILNGYLSVFNAQGNILIKKLKKEVGGSEFDVNKYITRVALDIIYETIMGTAIHTQDDETNSYVDSLKKLEDSVVKRSMRPWLYPDFIFDLSEIGKEQRANLKVVEESANQLITLRSRDFLQKKEDGNNESNQNDLGQKNRLAFLDLLLQHYRDGNMTYQGIREQVDTFLFAGHDTVTQALNFCVWLLSNHPQCQERSYKELYTIFGDSDRDATSEDLQNMKYLEAVLKESLRLYPSGPLFLRELDEEVKLDEFHLLAGTTVVIMPYFIHRHPDYYPEPEKFDPDRFFNESGQARLRYAFVPFSAGPRNCIGQKYAMMEMKCILSNILRNYKLLPGTTPLTLNAEITLRSNTGVHIKLENRK